MDAIGFSTGALALGDFKQGLQMQSGRGLRAVELSALRDVELLPLVQALDHIDLTPFQYVSLHAPSRIQSLSEQEIIDVIDRLVPVTWPVIVHPDAMVDVEAWGRLGNRVCLENMDQRKPNGRTVRELKAFFARLPYARFCLDLGHARQVDPTMSVCFHLMESFGDKLVQIHVSEVNDQSRHVSLNAASVAAIRRVSPHLPPCPWIIESVVPADQIDDELRQVTRCLHAPRCVPMMSLVD
jgi:hypothetical protein